MFAFIMWVVVITLILIMAGIIFDNTQAWLVIIWLLLCVWITAGWLVTVEPAVTASIAVRDDTVSTTETYGTVETVSLKRIKINDTNYSTNCLKHKDKVIPQIKIGDVVRLSYVETFCGKRYLVSINVVRVVEIKE